MMGRSSQCGLLEICLLLLSQCFRSVIAGMTYFWLGSRLMRCKLWGLRIFADLVAMSFDQHNNTVVLDMMRNMSFLPSMGLGRRQYGSREFIAIPDRDVPFGLGFIPTKVDYRYMAWLRKERVRARLTHTSFDYPVRPYSMSLAD